MSEEGLKEQELFKQRLASAEKWRELGVHPWGNGFKPSHSIAEVAARCEGVAAEVLLSSPLRYLIAGRVLSIRSFGKAAFVVISDRSGKIQLHVKKDTLGEAFAKFQQLDMGDFVGVEGEPFISKTGELTLAVLKLCPLTKALRPLPAKWHGLSDVELRYRQRYLDLIANPEVRETFLRRTRLVKFIRQFLDARDYVEVETPMMHPLVSGAAAKPFVTHHNSLDMPLFLRIAPELYLKRLVVGGFERVYELNRNFRNEGLSTRHNPEFSMLEFYEAFATYEDFMALTEEMLSEAAQHVTGSTTVVFGEHKLSFAKGYTRISMAESLLAQLGELRPEDLEDADKLRFFAAKKMPPSAQEGLAALSAFELWGILFEEYVEAQLVQPTFVTGFPVALSPLARRSEDNPQLTDRFELFVAGREIANAFSELNDPMDQRERFLAQLRAKERGQEETMDFDEDYLRALEHGLPPTAGEGIGIDRLAMLLSNAASIRDVILFPLLRSASK
ncbi:MAG: lysine--tRNA ligase [Cystobacterineae bacterium]|nr:lysine--tRNA ligase [Cystobacterineae bacterium]